MKQESSLFAERLASSEVKEAISDFFAKRLADSYGDEAAAEVHPHLPG